jgi:tRNA pseudouridine38-40 synthase
MRVFLYISYNGSKFGGFASQPNKNSVLDKIAFACEKLKITSFPIGSGRTDVGVHALNQVVCIDLPPFWEDMKKLKNMLNRTLHPFIHVKKIVQVKESVHARFSAKKRLYRYICYHGEFNPILSDFTHFCKEIDIAKVKKLMKLFEGEYDFGFFKKNGSKTKDDIRKIYKTDVYKYKNFTIFTFLGNGFLRSQIRMIVASLLCEDTDKEEKIINQLNKKEKTYTTLALPNGLYLSRIFYSINIYA